MNSGRRLRAIFLGTPEFAIPSLRALRDKVELLAVVTQPDRPQGRGRKVAPPPVAQVARELGVPVLQPVKLRDPAVVEALRALRPDVIVTVAYGKIIPPQILTLPPLGCINVHPSLLPKYRGASPIQAALANGERETGVTIMYQSEALDAGDIILQRRVPIAPDDTAQTLEARLAEEGAHALVEALVLIADGKVPRRPQDESQTTYAGKLTKESGRIDWTQSATALVNFIRAMDPWPSAYTWHRGKLLKICKGQALEGASASQPGVVTEARRGEGFVVATGQGSLLVTEVQPEGRRRMTADEYVRGTHLQVGERLGEPAPEAAGRTTG
ncbi:MAG TPA: methionyl-tRNA formyltransferase [bacterium]